MISVTAVWPLKCRYTEFTSTTPALSLSTLDAFMFPEDRAFVTKAVNFVWRKIIDIQPTRSAPGSQVLAAQEIRSRGTSAFALSILQSFFLHQVMLTCCTSSAFCSPGHLRRHWNTSTCRSKQKSNTRNCESSEIKVWDCHEMYCTPVCFGLLFAVDHANTHLACPRQSGNTTTSSTEGKASQSESESSLSLSERV